MFNASITGVILAGGQARRMNGQDKGLIEVAGKPMIEYVIDSIKTQTGSIIINANRNHEIYSQYGYPVIADEFSGYCGPLAGMASCLRHVESAYMCTLPCDSPYVPEDLVARLYQTLVDNQAEICAAHDGERLQPVFCLMKSELLESIIDYLERGERKIDCWFQQHLTVTADFSDKPETFINVNTPEDIRRIEPDLISA